MAKAQTTIIQPYLMLEMGAWRYPLLMVDKIIKFKAAPKTEIVGLKQVSMNEPYFQGHYPEFPIMPGVLINEVFGQLCAYSSFLDDFVTFYQKQENQSLNKKDDLILALHSDKGIEILKRIRNEFGGFLASNNIKYRAAVYPGSTIEAKCKLQTVNNQFGHYDVTAYVDNQVVASGKLVNWRGNKEDMKNTAMGGLA